MPSQSTDRGLVRTGTVLLLAVLALGVFAGAASASVSTAETADNGATVELRPTEETVSVGSETTTEVVVTGADNGIGAYDINIDLNNTKASIVDYEILSSSSSQPLDNSSVAADNGSMLFSAALLDGNFEPSEEIVLGSVTLGVNEAGAVAVTPESARVTDASNSLYSAALAGGVIEGVDQQPEATVDVRTVEDTTAVGSETTAEVVVTGAENGIGAYELDVGLNNSVASIVDYELTAQGDSGPLDNSEISADNSSIALDAALLDATYGPAEEIVVANLTLAVDEPGVAEIAATDARISGTKDAAYDTSPGSGSTLAGVASTPETGVDVRPTESEVSVGSETTAEVVVTGASNGVSAYEVDIDLNNTAASIVDYELTAQGESGPLDNSTISADGSSIALDAALLDAAYGPAEEIVIAELTLAVEERGAVEAAPVEASVIGTESREYDLALTGGVVEGVGLPPIVGDASPTDPDNDGLYEDVRGDNDVDVLDVQTLFNHLDAGVVQDNARAFDFSSADASDEVTILDVQALFGELGSGDPGPEPGPDPTLADTTLSNNGSSVECSNFGVWSTCVGSWEHELNVDAGYTLDDSSASADRVTVEIDPADGDAATKTLTDSDISGADASGTLAYADSWSDLAGGRNCNIDAAATYTVYDNGTVTDTAQTSATIDLGCSDDDPGPVPQPTFTDTSISNDDSSVECSGFTGPWGSACTGQWDHELDFDVGYTLDNPEDASEVRATVKTSDGDAANTTLSTTLGESDDSATLEYEDEWSDAIGGQNCNIDVSVSYEVLSGGTVTDTAQDSASIDMGC